MIPSRLAPVLTALILSGMMSFLVSGVATWKAMGLVPGFFGDWINAWVFAWPVAFPTLLLCRPSVTRLVERMTAER